MTLELEILAEFLTGSRTASLPWRMLGAADVRVLREWAGETLPDSSQRRLLRELRAALRRPQESEEEEDYLETQASLPRSLFRSQRQLAAGAALAARQAKLLLESCEIDESAEARRDGAVIALMLLAGLRRSEVVALQRGDYDDDDGRLRVAVRGRSARSVLLEGQTREAMDAWLASRGSWSGSLVTAMSPSGNVEQRGISPSAINRLLAKRSLQAGCAGVTPRDLRGRFLRQMRLVSRERPRCRYYQDEDGRPSWVLASLSTT